MSQFSEFDEVIIFAQDASDDEDNDEYCPDAFAGIMSCTSPSNYLLNSPCNRDSSVKFDNFGWGNKVQVINFFQHNKLQASENSECDLVITESQSVDTKPSVVKATKPLKKASTPRRRKRKAIMTKRSEYKKRKDVLMKGVLRRFRKHFVELFINFNRAKTLNNLNSEHETDQNGFPSNLVDEDLQNLTNESLEGFTNNFNWKNQKSSDLAYYLGEYISHARFVNDISHQRFLSIASFSILFTSRNP